MPCNDEVYWACFSFDEADIDDIFKENVRKAKYEKPTPVQKWAIPVILSGRDVMGCAQTGSGKTVIRRMLPYLMLFIISLTQSEI